MFVLLLLTIVFAFAVPLVPLMDVTPVVRSEKVRVRTTRVRPALLALVSSNRLPRPPRA